MASTTVPRELNVRRLRRRAAHVALLVVAVSLIVVLMPGLGEVREQLAGTNRWWLALAVALEALSGLSYVLLFWPVFCRRMSWRSSWEIGWSQLAVGSLVSASGLAGLALGAWVLHREGMAGERIARRSVAFFLLKSSVNFVAVALLGTAMALGFLGPHFSAWLTAAPAALSVLAIATVLAIPRLGPGPDPSPGDGRLRHAASAARRSVIAGVPEAAAIVRRRDPLVLFGAVG